jgi:hypothetical protein
MNYIWEADDFKYASRFWVYTSNSRWEKAQALSQDWVRLDGPKDAERVGANRDGGTMWVLHCLDAQIFVGPFKDRQALAEWANATKRVKPMLASDV